MARLYGRELTVYDTPAEGSWRPTAMMAGPDGGLWIGTQCRGILAVEASGAIRHAGFPAGVHLTGFASSSDGEGVYCATERGVALFWEGTWLPLAAEPPLGPTAAILVSPEGGAVALGTLGSLVQVRQGGGFPEALSQLPDVTGVNAAVMLPDGGVAVAAVEGAFLCTPDAQLVHVRPSQLPEGVLSPEDFLTTVAVDRQGHLFFGTRKAGILVLPSPGDTWLRVASPPLPDPFVRALLPLPDGRLAVGTYGGGFCILGKDKLPDSLPEIEIRKADWPLAQDEMEAVAAHAVNRALHPPLPPHDESARVLYLGEDRATRGQWQGRYGAYAWILAAMGAPMDFRGGPGLASIECAPRMGDAHRENDSLRYWIHARRTADPRALRNPVGPEGRQSSWDDAGELYPPSHDGPHLFVNLSLSAGRYAVALYFVNTDGIEGPAHWRTSDGLPLPNRFRDYRIEVKDRASTDAEFARLPLLAAARVTNFIQGVYHRFVMAGGRQYTIKVARQGSHNTILSGIFIDQLTGKTPGPRLRSAAHANTAETNTTKGEMRR